jgi:LSU ribosomal protein L24P
MPQGGIIDVPRPLDVSKVMLICPKCKKPTRVGFLVDGKKKFRLCKKCQSKI